MVTAEDAPAGTPAACRLCGSERTRRLFEKDGASYFRCRACGLVFSRSPRNPNLPDRLEDYEGSYLDYLRETPEDEAEFRALLAWMEPEASRPGLRLLDVGAGSGKWVRFLRRQSLEAYGVEPSRALYQHFLARDGCFSCESLESFAASRPARFDVVTAFDVIEHVEHPRSFLAAIASTLRPGGRLFVSTPDTSSLLARIAGRHWHYYNKYHLCCFDPPTLRRTAAEHGLRHLRTTRRGRLKSLGYLFGYFGDFVLGRPGVRAPGRLSRLVIPINLFDTMDLCFEKEAGAGGAPGA
jgi:SAM-dependent methyltransferase